MGGLDEAPPPAPIRVLIAGPDPSLHAAHCALVRAEPSLELAGSATTVSGAVEQAAALQPDVVVLDVATEADLRAVQEIRDVSPGTRAIALSADEGSSRVLTVLRCGAVAFVGKGDPPAELLDAIRRVARGQTSLPARVLEALVAAQVTGVAHGNGAVRIERREAERRAALAHLVNAEEAERRRIAAEIHDDSIQIVTAACMRLQVLGRGITDATQLQRLSELQETLHLAISRLRHLLADLHPPALDGEGVAAAIRLHLEQVGHRSKTAFTVFDRLAAQPPRASRVTLYRMTRELLLNVEKHAQAATATVALWEADGGFRVTVDDDGVGFDPDPGRGREWSGLAAVRERAELAGGWVRIASAPGRGTTVELWIPSIPDGEPAGPGSE
jgi:signal transduction histidine kinase